MSPAVPQDLSAQSSSDPERVSRATSMAYAGSWLAFCVLFATHAWVVDDAYITFRTVDNFVHGLGLRWNPDERVQVYTHPLWMFVCSGVYAFTHEVFFTVLGLSFVVSAAALLLAARALRRQAGVAAACLLMLMLVASKAFVDFSSSGLENPLTHLLLGAFIAHFLFVQSWAQASARQVVSLFLLAALGFVNREDTLLFFGPACAYALYAQLRARGRRAWLPAAAGGLPALAWLAFALFYYGSALPNTAYAKLMGPNITRLEQARAGVDYFLDSLRMDFATLPLCGLACLAGGLHGWRRRRAPVLCVVVGIALYLLYVLTSGAVATHMSGRFFSGPAFVAAWLLALLARARPARLALVGFCLYALIASSHSPLRAGTRYYADPAPFGGRIIDTREYVRHEGAGLFGLDGQLHAVEHGAYRAGLRFRASPQRVHVGGPGDRYVAMVGYSGYAAGPDKHIIDILGVTDPLLARIPIGKKTRWAPGHFYRATPAGYAESIEMRQNLIADPDLQRYYDVLFEVTRGPLFSLPRLILIWRLNTGQYEHLMQAYAERKDLRWL